MALADVDDTAVLTPGLVGRAGAGMIGGLVGGVVFGVQMHLTDTIPMVAQLVDRESLLIGWAVHMGIAAFIGMTHALIFGWFATLSLSAVLGVFYGLVWWVLGGLTLMPLRLGMGLFVFDATAWQSLAGHLAYGAALGVGYALAARALARRGDRVEDPPPRAGDSLALPAAPEPPPPDQGSLLSFVLPSQAAQPPSPAQQPGAGLTPLSPAARELRRRRQPS